MKKMEPERFIEVLRESLQEIAETMLFVEITPGAASLDSAGLAVDFSAVVGYSDALRGSTRLGAPRDAALKLASTLLGEEREEMDVEMHDAFAELANMIAGGVQTRLEDTLGSIRMSPPVVIAGRNHLTSGDHSFKCVHANFEMDGLPFFAEIFYDEECLLGGCAKTAENQKESVQLNIPMPHSEGFGAVSAPVPEQPAATPEVTDATRTMARELVQSLLPGLAEKVIREEIERIQAEVQNREDNPALAPLVHAAFAPRVMAVAREMARELVAEALPNVAERLVKKEIKRLEALGNSAAA